MSRKRSDYQFDIVSSKRVWLRMLQLVIGLVGFFDSPPLSAQSLRYSRIDEATVRIYALESVDMVRVKSNSGKLHLMGVPEAGHGSGLLVRADGLVLTAKHVVKGARLLAVQRPGSSVQAARVIHLNKKYDHAFVSITGRDMDYVGIPEQRPELAVRDMVYVIGYPLDASRTHPQSHQGIVSGVLPDGSLQLGIALNPGNSGGPIVDENETLLGIAVARADPERGAQGIGIAVPLEHILPGYHSVVEGDSHQRARAELAQQAARKQAEARLLAAMVSQPDPWIVRIRGEEPSEESERIAELLKEALDAGGRSSAELLLLGAAYYWNAAALKRDQKQAGWTKLRERAVEYCRQAAKVDAEFTKRSRFARVVLMNVPPGQETPTDPKPNPTGPSLESGDEPMFDGSSGGSASMDLDTYRSLPSVRIGPMAGLAIPLQLMGVGVQASLFPEQSFWLAGRYSYGVNFAGYGAESSTGHLFEVFAGAPLYKLNGRTETRLIVDEERGFNTIEYGYVKDTVPDYKVVLFEAGVISGPLAYTRCVNGCDDDLSLTSDDVAEFHQITTPAAGIRYIYFYHASGSHLTRSSKGLLELYAHVLGPGLGVPEGDFSAGVGREAPEAGSVGGRAGAAFDSGRFGFGQYELSVGYLPAQSSPFVQVAWAYLFY